MFRTSLQILSIMRDEDMIKYAWFFLKVEYGFKNVEV